MMINGELANNITYYFPDRDISNDYIFVFQFCKMSCPW